MTDTNSTAEVWVPVVGGEATHEVSNLGRLRSLERVVETRLGPRRLQSRILKTYPVPYEQATITINRRLVTLRIHVAVAAAFIGPRPDGMEVCHNNGDARDNRAENLRYDTHRNNVLDITKHGDNVNANKTHCLQGHEFTPENTAIYGGSRTCIACAVRRNRQSYAKRKAVN